MIVALKIFHVAVAAAWFGHNLLVPRDVKDSVHAMDRDSFLRRFKRTQRFGLTMALLTLLSGLGLMHITTGLLEAEPRIYGGLAAVVLILAVDGFFARPASRQIVAGIQNEDPVTAAAGEPGLRRAFTLESLLWILALGTMVIE